MIESFFVVVIIKLFIIFYDYCKCTSGAECCLNFLKEGAAPKFITPCRFSQEATVVIEHGGLKNVRVTPGNTTQVDTDGGIGEFAQWEVIPSDKKNIVQFKSKKTGGYLRIKKNGDVDADGKGKELTFFRTSWIELVNRVKLESQKLDGKYLQYDGKDKKLFGGDGKDTACIFNVFSEK